MREPVECLIRYTFNHAASLCTIPKNGPAAPTLGEKSKMGVVNLNTRIVFGDSGGLFLRTTERPLLSAAAGDRR
jgi:hypothetical protein